MIRVFVIDSRLFSFFMIELDGILYFHDQTERFYSVFIIGIRDV